MLSGQRLAYVLPERRRRFRDPRCELVVGAGDGLLEVEAGKARVPASLPRVGHATEDAGEAAQAVLPTLECIRRRHELTGQNLVLIDERGDCGSAP